jgi:hypothetical protein
MCYYWLILLLITEQVYMKYLIKYNNKTFNNQA